MAYSLAMAFEAYRQDVQSAEASRQRAIAAELARHRSALDDIEAAFSRDVAAARQRYSQGIIDQPSAGAAA